MRTRLIVQADDFGMCEAIDAGVLRAFQTGIVTQAMLMPPCPWFPRAASLAKEHGIPVGMHCTLTCEWDHMRWGPLTDGASLTRADGTFHASVEEALARVDAEEARRELFAQAERMLANATAVVDGLAELVVVGESEEMLGQARSRYVPNLLVAAVQEDADLATRGPLDLDRTDQTQLVVL